ncbi:hypothetical protein [Streptomyces sp. NPDC057686]|uniref:hypothetical protein n=1 Tax=Streptomyces sp. NPDC057686 TaxID=3346212 RepID=UPI0036D129B6
MLAEGVLLMAGGFAGVRYAVCASAATHTGAWPLVPGLLVAGAGLGFLVVPLVNAVLSAVPADIAGGASGIFSTAQRFGGALGAAVIGSVFFGALADGGPAHALTTAMPWVSAGFLLGAVLCLALPARRCPPNRPPRTPSRCPRSTRRGSGRSGAGPSSRARPAQGTAPAPWRGGRGRILHSCDGISLPTPATA